MPERFWSKVDKAGPIHPTLGTPCWLWLGWRHKFGHGGFQVGGRAGKNELAHRVSFFIHHGRWPEPCALHKCDNPPCVNPEHLFEGDRTDNNRDMAAKGRSNRTIKPRGEAHGCAKLTETAVREIRSARAGGEAMSMLAHRFDVSLATIKRVIARKQWRHVA